MLVAITQAARATCAMAPGPVGPGVIPHRMLFYPSACVVRDHEGTTRPRFGLNIARSAAEGIIISQGPGARQVAHKMEEPPRMRVRRNDERSRRIRRRKAGRKTGAKTMTVFFLHLFYFQLKEKKLAWLFDRPACATAYIVS